MFGEKVRPAGVATAAESRHGDPSVTAPCPPSPPSLPSSHRPEALPYGLQHLGNELTTELEADQPTPLPRVHRRFARPRHAARAPPAAPPAAAPATPGGYGTRWVWREPPGRRARRRRRRWWSHGNRATIGWRL